MKVNIQSIIDGLLERLKQPQVWGFLVSVAVLAVVSVAFFYPANFDGQVLNQHDSIQGQANGHEGQLYEEATGEKALWTNSLFGGMPTFQISPSYPSNDLFTWLNDVYGLGLPAPSNLLFMMMLGFLILLSAMRMRWYYALIGALAWGFSSYYIIIIGAGHIWKFVTLSYVPPTIGGLVLAYRGRYLAGAAMMSLFCTLQLNANHPQMTYYFVFVMAGFALAYLWTAFREHHMRRWWTATAVCAGAGILAVAANLPSLYNTYLYAKETQRAPSELSAAGNANATDGMAYDAIVAYSYGKGELMSLLIPNVRGGATLRIHNGENELASLDKVSDEAAAAAQELPLLTQLPQYFNDSEGTNGPVYVGALIFALALLGCFTVRGPLKWALVALTFFSILLSLGYNCDAPSRWMVDHFPMYSKFRAVESILVIAEFTIPLLAVMGLEQFCERYREDKPEVKNLKAFALAFGLPALLAFVGMVKPDVLADPLPESEQNQLNQYYDSIKKTYASQLAAMNYSEQEQRSVMLELEAEHSKTTDAAAEIRLGMVRSDSMRSLFFVLFGALVLLGYAYGRLRRWAALTAVGGMVLVDLYVVDKRYINAASFTSVIDTAYADPYAPDEVDKEILKDTDPDYRVADLTNFGDARRSYHHKMLGGYHAAKLSRVNDLLTRQKLVTWPVMNMLNVRYLITPNANGQPMVTRNYEACGNGWFVENIDYVSGADAEFAALDSLQPQRTAVADERFKDALGTDIPASATTGSVRLDSYTPNELQYTVDSPEGGVVVFSEVYFPWGWKATVDGTPATLGRVDYILRALRVPAGKHKVTLTFDPDSLHTTGAVAYGAVTLMYLLVLAALFMAARPLCRLKNS